MQTPEPSNGEPQPPQVLVYFSFYQGSILGPCFLPPAKWCPLIFPASLSSHWATAHSGPTSSKVGYARVRKMTFTLSRSSSREVRIRVPTFFLDVYFSRGTLPQKKCKLGTTGGPSCRPHAKALEHPSPAPGEQNFENYPHPSRDQVPLCLDLRLQTVQHLVTMRTCSKMINNPLGRIVEKYLFLPL